MIWEFGLLRDSGWWDGVRVEVRAEVLQPNRVRRRPMPQTPHPTPHTPCREDYNLESLEPFVVFGWLLDEEATDKIQKWSKALLAALGDQAVVTAAPAPKSKGKSKDKKGDGDAGKEAALSLFS